MSSSKGSSRPASGSGASPAIGPGGDALLQLHFTGVHVLSPALLEHVPAIPFACDVNRLVYPPLLASDQVRAVVTGGYWNDLGTPGRYLQANLDLLSGEAPVTLPGADPFAGVEARGARVFAARGASVDPSARLLGPVLVGPGAVVEAGAVVSEFPLDAAAFIKLVRDKAQQVKLNPDLLKRAVNAVMWRLHQVKKPDALALQVHPLVLIRPGLEVWRSHGLNGFPDLRCFLMGHAVHKEVVANSRSRSREDDSGKESRSLEKASCRASAPVRGELEPGGTTGRKQAKGPECSL